MILVVDDDKNIRLSLKLILERNEYEVALAEGPKEAMQIVRNTPAVELVLMDMNYSISTDGEEGLTLLKQVKVFRPEVPCILMTAWGSIDLAVQGCKSCDSANPKFTHCRYIPLWHSRYRGPRCPYQCARLDYWRKRYGQGTHRRGYPPTEPTG